MPVSSRQPIDPLLDPAQVAALLGVEPVTVARWAEAGKLNPVGSSIGPRRFMQADVLRLMVDIKRVQKGPQRGHPEHPAERPARAPRQWGWPRPLST